MRNFLDKNFNEVSGPASVGVTVNNGNFPHLQTAETRSHMVPYPITRMFIIVDNISAEPGSWLPIIQSTHNDGLPGSLIRILRAGTADCSAAWCLMSLVSRIVEIISHFIIHSSQRRIMRATVPTPDTPLFSKSQLSAEFHWPVPVLPAHSQIWAEHWAEHYRWAGLILGCIYEPFIFIPTHWLVSCSGRQLYCDRERSAWLLWMCSLLCSSGLRPLLTTKCAITLNTQ